ncbi:uncharacterized protein N7498_001686 [Penicillium cinerascens]|uniref:Uncharacterized protein n=1 Tax=Penicillium cinerascens TaxID=70096 RepID=A0A9W9N8N0_9EURO|nr:uncharacterized protein N7498_001686 [Penicillium cinerascens]KAJ5215279.1 hypothetical protein N7498_001686 [Penicillium cinerascens]
MQLLRDSWTIFKDLKLGDWVKYVMGMPCATISLFEAYHNELGLSIFSFLQQFPGDIDRFREVTKSIQPVDRFLYNTLSHALITVENKRPFHKLPIEAGHITGPLKELLGRPDKAIIRRLKILDARYARYKIGNNIAGGFKFEVETDFFTAVSELKAATIAWKMSEDALEGFGKINIHGLLFQDEHLRQLAIQWDRINHNVEEIAAAGGMDDNLREIAWHLYHLRNYFCLCAVLSGMAQAQLQVESTLTAFIDVKENYRQYRLQLHIEPSLPFLFPFIVELRRGRREVLRDLFSFLSYEQFLRGVEGSSSRAV